MLNFLMIARNMPKFYFFRFIFFLCLNIVRTKPDKLDKSLLNGKEVRALAFQFPLIFNTTKQPSGNYSFEGWGYDVLAWIAEYFNITVQYVVIDDRDMLNYGTIQGLIVQMEKKYADVIPMTIPLSLENFERLSFSQSYWLHSIKLLQPYPKEKGRITAPIRPFTSTVWLVFFCTALMFIGTMSIFASLKSYPIRYRISTSDTIYKQFFYFATVVTLQGYYMPYFVRLHVRITATAWLLAMVVFIYAYSGLLTAMLTVPRLEPIINTLEDLASSSRFRITKEIYEGVLTTQMLNATSGTYKILGDQLRNDPKLLVTDTLQMIENVLSHDCVYPGALPLLNYAVNEDLKSTGKCRMTVSSKQLPIFYAFHFGYAKESRIAPLVDRYFTPIMESSGLRQYMDKKHFPSADRCRVNVKQQNAPQAISVTHLSGVFIVLVIGMIVSFICFFFELIASTMKRKITEGNIIFIL